MWLFHAEHIAGTRDHIGMRAVGESQPWWRKRGRKVGRADKNTLIYRFYCKYCPKNFIISCLCSWSAFCFSQAPALAPWWSTHAPSGRALDSAQHQHSFILVFFSILWPSHSSKLQKEFWRVKWLQDWMKKITFHAKSNKRAKPSTLYSGLSLSIAMWRKVKLTTPTTWDKKGYEET